MRGENQWQGECKEASAGATERTMSEVPRSQQRAGLLANARAGSVTAAMPLFGEVTTIAPAAPAEQPLAVPRSSCRHGSRGEDASSTREGPEGPDFRGVDS